MTTLDLVSYYSSLLIYQYLGQPKAYATIQAVCSPVIIPQTSVQQIAFEAVPTGGTFVLSYSGNNTSAINWNDSTSSIQSNLQGVSGLNSVIVTGSISSQSLVVTFTGVAPPALLLEVFSNSLDSSGSSVTLTITETDLTLPLAVQNAYNMLGSNPAQGLQLDVLGKYAGVIRTGTGFNGQVITLDDADYLTLIKMAVITNSAGSSLFEIDNLIFSFFAGNMLVFDYADMRMSYLISTGVGSTNLLQLFVTEKLLPAPMAVQVSVIVAPIITAFFGFITYENPVQPTISRPFNNYQDYQTDWPFLTYKDSFVP